MDKVINRFEQGAEKRTTTIDTIGVGQMSNPFNEQTPIISMHRL
jgi:hypothetical protein